MSIRTSRQFALFLVAGGIAALANVGSRIIFGYWSTYAMSIVLAYIVGMIVAFMLNRLFVFTTPRNSLHHQVSWFVIVNIAALLQTLVVSLLLARWLFPSFDMHWHVETTSHVVGVLIPVVTSYLGHRYLTFR
ncbi:MAG TPA: GtrA family protein [Rhodanobacteraceae bacterium]|nr:GtrA family protein [Rhodanobacteraceae bacterium]